MKKILHLYQQHTQDSALRKLIALLNSEDCEHQLVENLPTDLTDVVLIHAHSWCNDGSVALKASQQTGIPYIISINESDLTNAFGLLSRSKCKNVIENASYIIFSTPHVDQEIADKLPNKLADTVYSHAVTIFNNIDPFWFQELYLSTPVAKVQTKLLFAGSTGKGSNLSSVIKATEQIRGKNLDTTLTILQLPGNDMQKTSREVAKKSFVHILECDTMEALREQLRSHDILVMPCESEVSTNIYAQALTQGLPIIYAQNGCFNGIYPESYAGYAVRPGHVGELVEKILLTGDRYATIVQHLGELQPIKEFNANEIYRKLQRVYERIKLR